MSRTLSRFRVILTGVVLSTALLGTACSDSTAPSTDGGHKTKTGDSTLTKTDDSTLTPPGGPTSPSNDSVQQDQSPVHVDQIGALVPSLQAASTTPTPGDFSPLLAQYKRDYTVDDCRVELGWLYDSLWPNWRHWGGVRVNCATRHSWIDATVALFYWNGSRYVQYGASNYGIRYNQFGSGTGLDGILRTSQYCVGGLRQYYWIVSATVRTERTGATWWTIPVQNTREGC